MSRHRVRPCEIPDGTPLDACIHGDALAVIQSLPDHCIDLVLTDPPWGTSRLRLDAAGRPPLDVWRELHRVCRPHAWLICFGTLPLFADIYSCDWDEAWQYVWHKPHGSLNMKTNLQPSFNHESIEVFHQQSLDSTPASRPTRRFFDSAAMRTYGHANYSRRGATTVDSNWHRELGITMKRPSASLDGGRNPSTVLHGHMPKAHQSKQERTDHPTQKPASLARYLIRGHCPPGGVVLDPYAGSGSTLIAARAVGRHYIGVELADRWHRVIQRKLTAVYDYDEARAEARKIDKRRADLAAFASAAAADPAGRLRHRAGQTLLVPEQPSAPRPSALRIRTDLDDQEAADAAAAAAGTVAVVASDSAASASAPRPRRPGGKPADPRAHVPRGEVTSALPPPPNA